MEQFANNVRRTLVDADVVDGDDVGMVQCGGGAGFQFKAAKMVGIGAGGGADQFEGNIASEPFIMCAKNFAHGSGADLFHDPVVTDNLARPCCENSPLAC